MTPEERRTPNEGAVREQLREEPGPRASSAPSEAPEGDPAAAGGRSAGGGDGFVEAPAGPADHEARPDDAEATPEGSGAAGDGNAGAGNGEAADPPVSDPARERDEYLALAQRTQADFDNFRRRAARDAAAAGARAKAGLVRELLPVVDNLERALAAAGDADDGLAGGVRMVHAELLGALERSGVAAYEPSGEPFDPTVHEALSTRPADGTEPGVVVDVVEKGYRLDETVLRPARVVVSA